jgi:hypothetical protein
MLQLLRTMVLVMETDSNHNYLQQHQQHEQCVASATQKDLMEKEIIELRTKLENTNSELSAVKHKHEKTHHFVVSSFVRSFVRSFVQCCYHQYGSESLLPKKRLLDDC